MAVNSFFNVTDAVKGQLCFNGHLYKLDPIYIPSLISTDSLQDGRRFSSFQKKIWKVTNYKRGWNVHFSIASTGCKLHVACTFLSNSYLLTKACTFSALTDNLLWQLEGDNRPDVTAVRDSTTEKERKIKLITILLPLHAHDDGKNYIKYCKKWTTHMYLKIGVWLTKLLHI